MEKILTEIIPALLVGVFIILARAIKFEVHRTAQSLAISLFFALPSGVIFGGVAKEFGYEFWTCLLITGLVVLLAENAMKILVENPEAVFSFLKSIGVKK